jgi:hypothetical protein
MKGAQPKQSQLQPDIANLSPEETVSNQEVKPVLWCSGTRQYAVTWVSPAVDITHHGGQSGKK